MLSNLVNYCTIFQSLWIWKLKTKLDPLTKLRSYNLVLVSDKMHVALEFTSQLSYYISKFVNMKIKKRRESWGLRSRKYMLCFTYWISVFWSWSWSFLSMTRKWNRGKQEERSETRIEINNFRLRKIYSLNTCMDIQSEFGTCRGKCFQIYCRLNV